MLSCCHFGAEGFSEEEQFLDGRRRVTPHTAAAAAAVQFELYSKQHSDVCTAAAAVRFELCSNFFYKNYYLVVN